MTPLNFRIRLASFGLLGGLVLAMYLGRPDGAQALHWWPMVAWTPIVLLPFVSLRFRPLGRAFLAALGLWGLALHLVREPSGLLFWPRGAKAAGAFRVVSLNCAAGRVAAAEEAFEQQADLTLLQEVGGRDEFVRAGRAAGYRLVSWSVDDAVFVREAPDGAKADPEGADRAKGMDFAAGTVALGGKRLRVVALRLLPPVFRLDLWSSGCWRDYAEDGARRRKRIGEILHEAHTEGPCLVGGDFNATNPRLVTDRRPDMAEAGRAAGRGWRGTGTNDFPFVAVDQLWASKGIRWTQAYAQKTLNSDHRMLIADFTLE